MKIVGINSLKKNSLKVRAEEKIQLVIAYCEDKQHVVFDAKDDLDEATNCFRAMDGVIAFITEETLHVCPDCRKTRKILKASGFHFDPFMHVPPLSIAYPEDDEMYKQWFELREWGRKQTEKDWMEDKKISKVMGASCHIMV